MTITEILNTLGEGSWDCDGENKLREAIKLAKNKGITDGDIMLLFGMVVDATLQEYDILNCY